MMNVTKNMNDPRGILRGDVFYADLSPVRGSEQGDFRPVS
jgi:hypothetical protein